MHAFAQTPFQESQFSLEFWTERDRILHPEGSAEERLLTEMQYVVSGMLYGYRFSYTPSYRDREVEERFELTPVLTIPWGDPSSVTLNVADRGTVVYGQFLYRLSDDQRAVRSRWQSAIIPDADGTGNGDIMLGYTGKVNAMQEAMRVALRTYLQGQTRNRPREATGILVLSEAPRIFIDEGQYVARVRIRILMRELQEYQSF